MKFYLSSYKMGRDVPTLRRMMRSNRMIAYIPNATDYSADIKRREEGDRQNLAMLKRAGLRPEVLDLRQYFGRQRELERAIRRFGGVWVRGGNTFVLRQAMRLSGFDQIFRDKLTQRRDFVYGGYSAGVCVLSKTLRGLEIVDDPSQRPYGTKSKVIWEGLGAFDYSFVPHYRSNHPESRLIEKTVRNFIDNKMLFKALRDGEVIIIK